ncbi:MAG: pyridoxal-phosphate-dependent aminotransferase family protein [Gaiellales bacterium]
MPDRQYLITPGPTPIPPAVQAAMALPMIHHRSPDFRAVLSETLEGLSQVFQTESPVVVLAGSGTAAMESAVVNLCSRADRVVVASAGNFGERWAKIAAAYGLDVQHVQQEWGERLDPGRIAAAAEGATAVFVTHSETSTGVVHDVQAIAAAVQPTGAAVVVDAVSSLAGVDLRPDEWGIDVVVGGSQKALMTPPGLAFASVSERAWTLCQQATLPRFYLDWSTALRAQEKGDTAYTPPVSLILGLRAAIGLILDLGLAGCFANNRRLALAAREGVKALGLELFSPDDPTSSMVTAFRMPAGLDGQQVYATLRDRHGIVLAGGQGKLRGQIMRIGHMGYMNEFDIVTALAGLEFALAALGYQPPAPGIGAARAVGVFGELHGGG